jgi:hypothetical protein
MMEVATLGGIQQKMIEALGELVQVLPFRTCRPKPDRDPLKSGTATVARS